MTPQKVNDLIKESACQRKKITGYKLWKTKKNKFFLTDTDHQLIEFKGTTSPSKMNEKQEKNFHLFDEVQDLDDRFCIIKKLPKGKNKEIQRSISHYMKDTKEIVCYYDVEDIHTYDLWRGWNFRAKKNEIRMSASFGFFDMVIGTMRFDKETNKRIMSEVVLELNI